MTASRLSRMSITIPPPVLSPARDSELSTRYSSGRLSTLSASDDETTKACATCHEKFTVFRHRYACHYCSLVVCRKCSIALRDVGVDAILLPAPRISEDHDDDEARHHSAPNVLSPPMSPHSASDTSHDSALLSMSSRYSTSSNPSPSGRRRLRERCCKGCSVFTSTSKPSKECQLCNDPLTLLKKKTKCAICQRFACKKCGADVDPAAYDLTPEDLSPSTEKSKSKKKTEPVAWVCTDCTTGHDAAKERRLSHCHVCKAKFHHFQRKCHCHACKQLMCLQCSFVLDGPIVPAPEATGSILHDVRECKPCHEKALAIKHASLARSLPTSSSSSIGVSLHSAFEFTKAARSSALGGALQTFERNCAIVLMLIGAITVVLALFIAYYVCFAAVVPEEWILAHYAHEP
ncbi:hypothetical protein SPRG_14457 [Saprolegnia parasitica CBS 223.65]|uniref:FYVE-type domain-containing protein n=1 Tax=Saprolegnia parasitica (strain CBS 223.65) TaxID=695850 RepID=A0A067C0I6_SAPPC|nr:hypothetical protein SPRG_14457 [Saprolegnia parasitica CBS 223.65]KDO20322.1 hypothetical protein SPRG_14457 [Saprolegnia parasitica CBS 223.65]|eukprot:XP_012208991.1 hypothetical protein SPRG_14457 [Saprolegnia parasitica CBS 223.65]